MVKPDNTGSTFVRYVAVFVGTLCVVGLVLMLVHRLLPLLQVLVPVLLGSWIWQRYHQKQQRWQKRLDKTFYKLLQVHQGRMMLLDFAMSAKISAIAARHYLNARASEFAARFEVTEQGDVLYVFSSLQFDRSQPIAITADMRSTEAPTHSLVSSLPESLTQAELAKRLGVSAKTISRQKRSALLNHWTQLRDPAGVGWFYSAQTRRFCPTSNAPIRHDMKRS